MTKILKQKMCRVEEFYIEEKRDKEVLGKMA